MVARGVCEFHGSERERAKASAAPRSSSQLAGVVWSTLALAAMLLAPAVAAAEDVLVGAAVSLREPLTAIARDFEAQHANVRVLLSFGASSTLAAQARAGAPLDVFVSANPTLIDRLEREAWGEARSDIARNALVVVTARHLQLGRAADLDSSRVRRLALPTRAVPLGGYAREWLEGRGLLDALAGRVIQTEHARATLAAVEAGHADAAIVYVTDARSGRGETRQLPIAADEQPAILYSAALRVGAGALDRAFFAALGEAQARAQFADAGFGAP